MNTYAFKYNAIYRGNKANYTDSIEVLADCNYTAQKVFDMFCYDADILIINNLNITVKGGEYIK